MPLSSKAWRSDLAAIAWRAGVKNVHPHRFRAHFAIKMLRAAGGDLQAVQKLLGHSSINSTQHYTRYDAVHRSLLLMRDAGDIFFTDC
jgi:site-specific recombinase XerD